VKAKSPLYAPSADPLNPRFRSLLWDFPFIIVATIIKKRKRPLEIRPRGVVDASIAVI